LGDPNVANKQNKQTNNQPTLLNQYLLAHQKTLVEIEPIHQKRVMGKRLDVED
jgi:hypothetical protein